MRTHRWFGLSLFLALLMVSACNPGLDQVFPTPLPTETETPTETPTLTPLPATLTPTPGITPLSALTTATPVFPTPRPDQRFTPTRTSIPYGSLRIEYFQAEVSAVEAGAIFRLFWSVQGIDQVQIYELTPDGEREQVWKLGRTGSLEVRTRENDKDAVQYELVIGDETNSLTQTVTVAISCVINCTDSAAFSASAVSSGAAQQIFEHGVMIWLETERRIYVLYDDKNSPAWASYPDSFTDGQQDSDPTITAPPGLLQPVRGFGLVWRTQAGVRDRLGWATLPEIGYTAQIDGAATADSSVTYISSQEGGAFALTGQGQSWQRIQQLPTPVSTESQSPTPSS
ncbi:MAG: hypothetical protein KF716_19435 [Anaerolineae bacterium]|nr:hypothetical protein [Anaerolineae bacterium]